jgi:hypothetical protein
MRGQKKGAKTKLSAFGGTKNNTAKQNTQKAAKQAHKQLNINKIQPAKRGKKGGKNKNSPPLADNKKTLKNRTKQSHRQPLKISANT